MFGIAARASSPSASCISFSAVSAACTPAPWLAPTAARPASASASTAFRAETPPSVSPCSSKVSIATTGSDEMLRTAASAVQQLLELEERLDEEQVDATGLERGRLLREDLVALVLRELPVVAERADRAADVDVAAGDLARLARELRPGAVDLPDLVLEPVRGQLPAVGAEGVRLDQVGPRVDEADVKRDHGLGRGQVRFLGEAQARDRAGDQRAHAPVGYDNWPVLQAFFERRRHRIHSTPIRARPVIPKTLGEAP